MLSRTLREGAYLGFSLEPIPPLEKLEREWRALEALSSASLFCSWLWIGTWLETLPDRGALQLVRVTDADKTVALAIVSASVQRYRRLIKARRMSLNVTGMPDYDCIAIEHNGLICAAPQVNNLGRQFVHWFAATQRDFDELYLPGITNFSAREIDAPAALLHDTVDVPYYFVDLARLRSAAGDFVSELSPNARQQLRRSIRHWEKFGSLNLAEPNSLEEANYFFDAMKALHIASWEGRGKGHAFVQPYVELFHRRLLKNGFASGTVEIQCITAGERVLGFLYNLHYRDRVYAYQSGFISDERGRPGYVSHYLAIRQAMSRNAGTYDFLAGHNRLKESFSTDCRTMHWIFFRRRHLRFRLFHSAKSVKTWLCRE